MPSRAPLDRLLPGLMLAVMIALAVRFVSEQLGGPAMLYALLFGMAFNFLGEDPRFTDGIRCASRTVLRLGVALLGLRITAGDVAELGWPIAALVIAAVFVTIVAGWAIGRACGLGKEHAVLSAGAVAICGASAALAISSVLPQHRHRERNTILTVAAVTALSTAAMVIYPVFVTTLGLDQRTAGVFLGASIVDVAQVVGAGYIVSPETGEISTLIKLMRVACLLPVVLMLSLIFAHRTAGGGQREPLLPPFLLAFLVLVIGNSLGWVPDPVHAVATPLSSGCLLAAVAALGVKTSLKALAEVGPAPIVAIVLQTLLLAAFTLAGLLLLR